MSASPTHQFDQYAHGHKNRLRRASARRLLEHEGGHNTPARRNLHHGFHHAITRTASRGQDRAHTQARNKLIVEFSHRSIDRNKSASPLEMDPAEQRRRVIDRTFSLPEDQREAELKKIKEQSGMVLYCGNE